MARYCGFKENEAPFVYRDKAMIGEARPSTRTGGLCGDEGLISRTEGLFNRPLKDLSCGRSQESINWSSFLLNYALLDLFPKTNGEYYASSRCCPANS